MKKFTFLKNNFIKVAMSPLVIIGYFISIKFPRNKKLWVYGRKMGYGDGSKAVFDGMKKYPEILSVWLTQSKLEAVELRERGINSFYKNSFKGFWYTLRADVVIICFGFGDVNRFTAWGGRIVQLWHGTPIKKLNLDHEKAFYLYNGSISNLLKWAFKFSVKHYHTFVTPSKNVLDRYQSSFGISIDKIKSFGDPRCDQILNITEEGKCERKKYLFEKYWKSSCDPKITKLILYAPTWRDGEHDPIFDFSNIKLKKVLEQNNFMLILRSHPTGYGVEFNEKKLEYINFLPSKDFKDINEWLPVFDVLVSDYSGVIFDYSLLVRPIIFYAPDLDEYQQERGLYESYTDFTKHTHCKNIEGLANKIEEILTLKERREENLQVVREIEEKYNEFNDGKNTKRLIAYLLGN